MIPLVLLPGLLTDARLWAPQRAALAGASDVRVADLTRDDSLAGMAARMLDAAAPRFALAGLSMGGYVALEVLRRAPERVAGLALLDTTARPDTPEQTARRTEALALARAGAFARITPAMLPLLVHPAHLEDPAVGGLVKDMAAAVGPEAFARQQNAIMARPDSRPDLPQIACPTLVVVGRQDQITPPDHAEEMAAAIPNAHLTVIEECGHLSTLDQPAAVGAALAGWLARCR